MNQHRELLLNHYMKYPDMAVSDYLKLLYQSAFGPKHLYGTPDVGMITHYLTEELVNMVELERDVIEDIGNGYVRIYLEAIHQKVIDSDDLVYAFYQSMSEMIDKVESEAYFMSGIEALLELITEGKIELDLVDAKEQIDHYLALGIRPIHHSIEYRSKHHPHYRVVLKKYIENQ